MNDPHPAPIRIGDRTFEWGARTYVMGIINVTPDSFSGDGILDPGLARKQAQRMVEDGADLLDLGAESTRPGAESVTAEEEWTRLGPALRAVRAAVNVPITVDTWKAEVAARAFEAGADALNDIQGLRGDPTMPALLAKSRLPAVLMHNQRGRPSSGDVVTDLRTGFEESLRLAREAGVDERQLLLDPGFGFGWQPQQNLELLRRLGELRVLGRPLLLGASRKSTIGLILDRAEDDRLWGTAAAVTLAIEAGADMVRVHDVRAMVDVVKVADAAVRGWNRS